MGSRQAAAPRFTLMRWPNPLICRQPGDLASHHHHAQRGGSVQRLERRLRRRYAAVRILQQVGWAIPQVPLLRPLHALASLVPRDPITQGAARELLRQLNRPQLTALAAALAPGRPVLPLIVGCRSRLARARAAQGAFNSCSHSRLQRAVIVIGNPRLPDWALRFCPQQRILELGVDDHYEGLPQKVTTALAVLALLKAPPAVLKLDDDARPADLARLSALVQQLQEPEPRAAGFPIVTPTPLHLDRGWHMGKSHRANLTPFSSLGARTWLSGGAGYLLNPAAVDLIGLFWMHSSGFIASMLYEDVCVSMLLQAADTPVHWLKDPADLGLLSERQQEFQDGQWGVPAEFFQATP